MIIETTSNVCYCVRETGNPDLAHVWLGVQVRFDKTTKSWVKRPNRKGSTNRPQLVSKAHLFRVHDRDFTCAM
jgi:hypothetical protein